MGEKLITYSRRGKKRPASPPNPSPLRDITGPTLNTVSTEADQRTLKKRRKETQGLGSGTLSPVLSISRPKNHGPRKSRTQPPKTVKTHLTMGPVSQPCTPVSNSRITNPVSNGSTRSGGLGSGQVSLKPKGNLPSNKDGHPGKKVLRCTSSSRLKENLGRDLNSKKTSKKSLLGDSPAKGFQKAIYKTNASAFLASPFTSRPSSPQPSSAQFSYHGSRRALSDTKFNPNVPSTHPGRLHAQSATNSPTQTMPEANLMRGRRPSAPSSNISRPDPSLWTRNLSDDPGDDLVNALSFFDLNANFPRGPQVDFNRPPSQLSLTSGYYDDKFFDDVQGISTPVKNQNTHILGQESDLADGTTWITDSIISPPALKRAYSWPSVGKPEESTEEHEHWDSLDLGTLKVGIKSTSGRRPAEKTTGPARGVIENLLASLDLGNDDSRTLTSPTHALEYQVSDKPGVPLLESPVQLSPFDAPVRNKPRGRDRRGTIRASDFNSCKFSFNKPETEPTLLPACTRTRSGTIVQAPRVPAIGRKRDRSDTIVAGTRDSTRRATSSGPTSSEDQDPGVSAVGRAACEAPDSGEDELNLKGGWLDEPWVVPSPPSPVVPRPKKRRGIKDWQAGHILGKGIGTWGMKGHDEDDGTDDPLLLQCT